MMQSMIKKLTHKVVPGGMWYPLKTQPGGASFVKPIPAVG